MSVVFQCTRHTLPAVRTVPHCRSNGRMGEVGYTNHTVRTTLLRRSRSRPLYRTGSLAVSTCYSLCTVVYCFPGKLLLKFSLYRYCTTPVHLSKSDLNQVYRTSFSHNLAYLTSNVCWGSLPDMLQKLQHIRRGSYIDACNIIYDHKSS